MPLARAEIMEEAGTIMKAIGYRYNNEDGDACIEYHVDNLPEEIYEQEICPNLPMVEN